MKRKMLYAVLLVAIALPLLALVLSLTAKPPTRIGPAGGKLLPCLESPNCVCSQATDDAHRVEPLPFSGKPEAAFGKLKDVLASMMRMKIVKSDERYIRAESTSRVFRFVDDVEFLLDAERQEIHVRSASRSGYSDFGVNRKRVQAIREKFTVRE